MNKARKSVFQRIFQKGSFDLLLIMKLLNQALFSLKIPAQVKAECCWTYSDKR